MKVINESITEIGLGRVFAKEGFTDLKVIVGGEEIMCAKAVLMSENDTFRRILEDDKFQGDLEIFEECSIGGFLELEKFYSGSYIDINVNNVIDIMSICLYYDEKRIIPFVLKFIYNHLNDELMIKILDVIHLLSNKNLVEIKDFTANYLLHNGYRMIRNDNYLFQMKIEDLYLILTTPKLLIENENWLLELLYKWYCCKVDDLNDEDEKKKLEIEFTKLLQETILFKKINGEKLSQNTKKFIQDKAEEMNINKCLYDCSNVSNEHVAVDLSMIEDIDLQKMILKYYIDDDDNKLEYIDIEDIIVLQKHDLKDALIKLINTKYTKLAIICMLMIIDCGGEIDLSETPQLLGNLCNEYRKNPSHLYIKCISYYMKCKEYVGIVKTLCSYKVLLQSLKFSYLLADDSLETVASILREIKLSENEENDLIEIIKYDDRVKKYIKEVSIYTYPTSKCCYNGAIRIKPTFKGDYCKFSLTPNNNLIQINEENGEIYSVIKDHDKIEERKEYSNYTLKCSNMINSKSYSLDMKYKAISFSNEDCNENVTISDNGMTITSTEFKLDKSYSCYLNKKIHKNKYYIRFKCNRKGCFVFGLSTERNDEGKKFKYIVDKNINGRIDSDIGKVVNISPNFSFNNESDCYEAIIDMKNMQLLMSQNDSDPVLLVKELPPLLHLFFDLRENGISVELLSVAIFKEN